jgi:hypothetical protein
MVRACLLVLMQPSPTFEEEFNDWYDTDHVPERLAVPGFLAARRYVCLTGWPAYLVIYDLNDLATLASPAYLQVAEGQYTPWTRRVLARVRVRRDAVARCDAGDGVTTDAPHLLLTRFIAAGEGARPVLLERLLTLREAQPEVAAVRLLAIDGDPASYYAAIELRSPLSPAAVTAACFAPYASAIDLWNLYARR